MTRHSVVLALFLVGCVEVPGVEPGVEEATPREVTERGAELDAVLDGADAFSVDLYAELSSEEEGNLFFSPYSVVSALGMTLAGANGETQDELAAVLGVSGDEGSYHHALGALTQDLNGDLGRPYTLAIANRVYLSDGLAVENDYLAVTGEDYGAEAQLMGFSEDPEGSRQTINAWVSDNTAGMVPELLPNGSIHSLTQFVLTNAIYFLGDWESAFDPADTAVGPFVTATGPVNAELMSQTAQFGMYQDSEVQVLRLPYKGKEVSMWVVLPVDGDGLAAVETSLEPTLLEVWANGMSTGEVEVTLPKFDIATERSLVPSLRNLGVNAAFDNADFTGITPSGHQIWISDVLHSAVVSVDEVGTEAAAATAVVGETDSLPPEFRADHPFVFLIRDDLTGAILFMGRVADPTAG